MAKRNIDFRKVFAPSDTIAFVVIALGLIIGLALDEMAVRLIGVCIAILGGVALFMMISPRLAELSMQGRPPRPSESPALTSETTRDGQTKRRVFERAGFVEEFGIPEEGNEETFVDTDQIQLFDEPSRPQRPAVRPVQPQAQASAAEALVGARFDDTEGSSVRIVGVKKSATATGKKQPLPEGRRIEERRASRAQSIATHTATEEPTGSASRTIESPDGETIVIRPKKSGSVPAEPAAATVPLADPTPATAPPATPAPIETTTVPDATDDAVPGAAAPKTHEEPTTLQPAAETEDLTVEDVVPSVTDRAARRQQPNVAVNLFTDDAEEDDSAHGEPRKEFDYLLNRVLMVIRSATNARTAAFFWVNWERQQLIVEARITEASEAFTDQRKMPLGRDALSQIVQEGRPEILTEISPTAEMDLLPYYKHAAGTISFIGVPVYYRGKVVGVLCADSQVEDAYSEITVGFFGQFTKLISGLVRSYTNSFDLIQSASISKALLHLRSLLGGAPSSRKQVIKALFETTINSMDVSTIGVVLHNRDTMTWNVADVKSVTSDYASVIHSPVDLQHSSVGKAILTGEADTVMAPDPTVRVVDAEPMLVNGQFVAIPLRSANSTYGALFIENGESALTAQDMTVLEALGDQAGLLLEVLAVTENLHAAALLDHESGVLNAQGFTARMREEFTRALDYQLPLTVCYIRIDKSRVTMATSPEQSQRIFMHVMGLLREQLREYDVIGKLEHDLIGIALVGYKAQQAQMFTENMRGRIASAVLDIDGKRFTVTVSTGVAESTSRDSAESLLRNVQTALAKSEEQGNRVTVF